MYCIPRKTFVGLGVGGGVVGVVVVVVVTTNHSEPLSDDMKIQAHPSKMLEQTHLQY
jgi:hypothetical protein